jgi:hypothetical protein
MKNKPLSQTNTHLRDLEKRRRALLRSVLSSSAVEGIHLTNQDDVSDVQAKNVRITLSADSAK